ncbi:2-oxoacid:acceptor oxidoreductase family protein, partial [bacterium]|nr:2-oxoacid:acceptor oxidoreductase family protein [candidate division CSSED10-310 bacterium]
ILAQAAILSNNYPEVSAFPSFGTERRGAPVQAFIRISNSPIWARSHIKQADIMLVLDETVFGGPVISRVKDDGTVIINTWKCPADIRAEYPFGDKKITIITSDLTQIAFDLALTNRENHPIVNTTVLGVLTRIDLKISMEDLGNAIKEQFGEGPKTEMNIKGAKMAADSAVIGEVG